MSAETIADAADETLAAAVRHALAAAIGALEAVEQTLPDTHEWPEGTAYGCGYSDGLDAAIEALRGFYASVRQVQP